MFIRKCIKNNNPCEIHKDGKYIKWSCRNSYSKEDRRKIYLKNKIKCSNCNKPSTAKYCKECYYLFNDHHLLGKKLPKKWRENMSKGQGKQQDNANWKGNEVTYSTKHKWIAKIYGNPKKCEDCGVKGKKNKGGRWTIQWANKSGKYPRDVTDYKGLCTKCHSLFDGKTKSIESYKHGTNKKYRKGCRCELCKKAKRLYRNKLIKYS